MHLQLRYFGSPKVLEEGKEVVGFRSSKAQALLCYLAVTGRHHTRVHLAALLWGEMPETNAAMNLRKTLMNLRPLLRTHLEIARHQIGFSQAAPYWLDVATFEAGISPLKVGEPLSESNINQVMQATELYAADFLEGFYVRDAPDFEQWALGQRMRLRDLLLNALRAIADYYANQQVYSASIEYTKRLLAFEPLDEDAHRQLMFLLAHSGQRTPALGQYEIFSRLLAVELGVEPTSDTTALYNAIRAGELADLSTRLTHRSKIDQLSMTASNVASGQIAGNASGWNSLPVYVTPFVGRRKELADITNLLTNVNCRLLTLVTNGASGLKGKFSDGHLES